MKVPWKLWFCLVTFNVTNGLRLRRVINGDEVGIERAKFMVHLVKYTSTIGMVSYLCSGALIRYDWVLTAAHCMQNCSNMDLRVIGNSELKFGSQRRMMVVLQTYVPERMYKNIRNPDVALLKLSEPLTGTNVAIVDYDSAPVPTGAQLDIYGWGQVQVNVLSTVLRHGKLLTLSNELCRELFGLLLIEEAMICTGHPSKYAIALGDSGSPLLRNNKIVAIASINSKRDVILGVSIRIEYFVEWIEATLAGRIAGAFVHIRD